MRSVSVSGKMILSGEYAVVFGKRGIAIPSSMGIDVRFTPDKKESIIQWEREDTRSSSTEYVKKVAEEIRKRSGIAGTYRIRGTLPIGKGMGASTAIVIAMCRAAIGEDSEEIARAIEDAVNLGHSGLDFAVIWKNMPLVFRKNESPAPATIDLSFLKSALLIDTGTPGETTPELVSWVRTRYKSGEPEVIRAIETIDTCTERILSGEPLRNVMRDHHRAQVVLGVVPEHVQKIIADIETKGGAAKVIGAGGRTGGGGMVLSIPA